MPSAQAAHAGASAGSSSTSIGSSTTTTTSTTPLQQRQQHYGANIALSYDSPLLVERGEGCYLFDEGGRSYLDCVNNVAHVGHANAEVASAVCGQLSRVNTNSRYLSRELNEYCRELSDTLPQPLEVVYLVNSGSEANDLALRIAAAAAAAAAGAADAASAAGGVACEQPGSSGSSDSSLSSSRREHVVVMAGAYHGHISSMIALSPYKFWGPGGSGQPDWVHVLPAPDTFRGLNLDGAAAARAVLAQAAAAGGRVVAFFCESIISCGGQLMLPPGYLHGVYAVMREAGVVCVADEVQTGFGRSGSPHMWAFQHQQPAVVPDIVTLGKSMGNGFPIAGVVTTPALAAAFASGGMEYFNTTGGCNAAVAAGRAVLREIRDRQLQAHAAEVGRHLLSALQELQQQFPSVLGDVRSQGLFAGLEFVTCPVAKTPAPLVAKALKEGAKARGVLLSSDGPVGHVVKVKPPLVGFGTAQVDAMVAVMREVLAEMTGPGEAWQQLLAAEQRHHEQHAQPILARYRDNEQRVWQWAAALSGGGDRAAGKAEPLVAAAQLVGSSCGSLSDLDCSVTLVGAGGGLVAAAAAAHVAVKE